LYVFYEQLTGQVILFRYNLIRKQADVPLVGHGFALFENGHLVVFSADNEPTLVHPLQVWETPFTSESFHAQASVANDSELARIGNPELVRGIAELNTVITLVERSEERRVGKECGGAGTAGHSGERGGRDDV